VDSLTQATLGAAVGVAVLGRHRPVWQAALTGALVGTLPDLDVFIDQGDPVRNMVLHRAETHALFWQALASPLIAFALAAITGSRELLVRWWVMVILGLFTHAMLDAITVYGTQIGLPFTDYPFGLGSLFIIDPVYTLPLLIGVLGAVIWRGPARLRWNTVGLVFSLTYAGWSIAAQAIVTQKVIESPAAAGLERAHILVTPTAFNTLLWRIVLVREDFYAEGYYSLLDPLFAPGRPLRFERFARGGELEDRTRDFVDANLIRDFSKGFYSLRDDGRRIWITDLRMGQHPYYGFSFAFAEHQSEPLRPITPIHSRSRLPVEPGLDWLGRRILGEDISPPR
jgi:inner membrane protein